MTRQEYLDATGDKQAAYRTYYSQFVSEGIRELVLRVMGLDRLRASHDPHFNDIPLSTWDAVFAYGPTSGINSKMRELGDYPTKAGLVCVAKEAARQVLEQKEKAK